MTEPEFIKVLSTKFRIRSELLSNSSRPEFPNDLLKDMDDEEINDLLIEIFNESIMGSKTMCELEKSIIREVRTWEDKPLYLKRACHRFLEEELKSNL